MVQRDRERLSQSAVDGLQRQSDIATVRPSGGNHAKQRAKFTWECHLSRRTSEHASRSSCRR